MLLWRLISALQGYHGKSRVLRTWVNSLFLVLEHLKFKRAASTLPGVLCLKLLPPLGSQMVLLLVLHEAVRSIRSGLLMLGDAG